MYASNPASGCAQGAASCGHWPPISRFAPRWATRQEENVDILYFSCISLKAASTIKCRRYDRSRQILLNPVRTLSVGETL